MWTERDFRVCRQWSHCDTGRPFRLMCWRGRSGLIGKAELVSWLGGGRVVAERLHEAEMLGC